jgi:hypothetical protein
MYQSQNSQGNNEDRLFHELGAKMTGGSGPFIVRVLHMVMKINALYLMIFLRKRIGFRMFGIGSLFFAGVFNFIVYSISLDYWSGLLQSGDTQGYRYSGAYLMQFLTAFNFLFIIKWIIAALSLRSRNPRWYRHRLSVGESIVYPLVHRLLKPLKLVNDGKSPPRFWKMTEAKWTQYVEPLGVGICGILVKQMGYVALGHNIIFAACCLFFITFQAFTNSALPGQANQEAGTIRPMITADQPQSASTQKVIRD